jgi:DNA-binding MarR family transcriptional regulator
MKFMNQEEMLASLDRVMRLLRRRPSGKAHMGRGVFRMLNIIHSNEGISTRELAELLDLRPSSLNEKLAQLEKDQLLMRVRSPLDQRVFVVQLEPKCIAMLEEISEDRKRFNEAIGEILSDEETKILTHLALKLSDGLELLTLPENPESSHYHHGSDRRWR